MYYSSPSGFKGKEFKGPANFPNIEICFPSDSGYISISLNHIPILLSGKPEGDCLKSILRVHSL